MPKPRRVKAQRQASKYRHRSHRQSGNWKRYGTEWAWTEHLTIGVKSAWLALWRLVWWLNMRLALLLTLVLVGHWVGWLRVVPEEIVVPLRAGLSLYWVLAAVVWIVVRVERRLHAQDLYTRNVAYTLYAAEYGYDPKGFSDLYDYGGGGDSVDFDFGDFDLDGGD